MRERGTSGQLTTFSLSLLLIKSERRNIWPSGASAWEASYYLSVERGLTWRLINGCIMKLYTGFVMMTVKLPQFTSTELPSTVRSHLISCWYSTISQSLLPWEPWRCLEGWVRYYSHIHLRSSKKIVSCSQQSGVGSLCLNQSTTQSSS